MILKVTTETVEPSERIGFWRGMVQDCFGLAATDIEPAVAAGFRQTMSIRQIGSLTLMEVEGSPFRMRCARNTEAEEPAHCLATVIIPMEGSGVLRTDRNEMPMAPGALYASHSCKLTTLAWEAPSRYLVATIPTTYLSDRCPDWACDTSLSLPTASGIGGMFVELIQSLHQHEECLTDRCRQEAVNLTLSLLTSVVRQHDDAGEGTRMQDYHKRRIRQFVLAHLSDPELDIARIASAVNLSRRYIHRLFADEPLPLMKWVYEQRLIRCHHDLANPDMAGHPISKIAYAWGFNSLGHFCHTFQKRFGVTPSEIQKQAKVSRQDTFDAPILHS